MTMNTASMQPDTSVSAPDDFLTAAFGYPCRALVMPGDLDQLASELAVYPAPAFMWTKISGRDDPSFAKLTALGFTIAVEEITYERPADAPAHDADSPVGFTVHRVTPDDIGIADEIGALAAANQTTSRFHQDPRIPNAVAAEVKKRWAMNFFAGRRGQEMFIATQPDGRIVGFNQVLVNPDCKVIDLICTASNVRRRGVARAIAQAMFAPSVKTRVGSQANNTPADAFYRSLGFVPIGSSICLHWHAGSVA